MVNPFEETLQAGQVGIDTLPDARETAIARSNAPFYGGRSPRDESIGYAGQEVERIKQGSLLNQMKKDSMTAPWASGLRSFGAGYGIPATNQGYRVQQAGGPLGLYEMFLHPYMPWYDKEQDKKRYKPYIDPEIERNRLEDEEKDKAKWLSEYGPSETGGFYPDKIIRDLYPE